MEVSLSGDLENFVTELVHSGSYHDPAEVVGDALLALKRENELRKKIQAGIDELDQGLGLDGEKVFQQLRDKATRLAKSSVEAKP